MKKLRPLVQLDDAEASATLHDHVEAAVVEPLDHLGHRGERADGTQAVVVGIDEANSRSSARHSSISSLYRSSKMCSGTCSVGRSTMPSGKEADLGHLQNYAGAWRRSPRPHRGPGA